MKKRGKILKSLPMQKTGSYLTREELCSMECDLCICDPKRNSFFFNLYKKREISTFWGREVEEGSGEEEEQQEQRYTSHISTVKSPRIEEMLPPIIVRCVPINMLTG